MARFSGNLESTIDLRCVYLLVNKLIDLISHIKRDGYVFTFIFRQNDRKRESKYSIKTISHYIFHVTIRLLCVNLMMSELV